MVQGRDGRIRGSVTLGRDSMVQDRRGRGNPPVTRIEADARDFPERVHSAIARDDGYISTDFSKMAEGGSEASTNRLAPLNHSS